MIGFLLLFFTFNLPFSDAATTAFTTKPPNPTIVQEGKSFTLEWTYTLDGTVVIAQFYNTSGGGSAIFAKAIGTGNVSVEPDYQGRFSGQVTNTKAELTIVGMQRSEQLTCRFVLTPTGAGSLTDIVEITIHYSSSITGLSGETAIIEGGNVTLECRAVGNPKPNITWARLPDNSDAAMPLTNITEQDAGMFYSCPLTQSCTLPLTNISRHDAGMFRCTADNGVGRPATGDVLLVVQYAPERVYLNTNLTSHNVCQGMMATFICTVEASNPAVHTFTLLGNGTVISNKRDSGVWIWRLTTSGNATYKCMANNSVGVTGSNYITFTVEAPASVTTISNSIAVKEGQSVTLVCHGFGLPAPRISWSDAWNVVMQKGNIWKLHKINRNMTGQYSCMASNGCGNDSKTVDIDVQYPFEATCSGENDFVAEGVVKTFTCPVDGNPEPNIEWYSEKTGRKISTGKQIKTEENGCYTCVARNYLGSSVSITQCLIVEYERSTTIPSITASGEQEIRALLTINANYKQAFEDVNSATFKAFVEDFVGEMDKVYKNIPEYIRTEVTQLRPGSVIVYFVLYFKTALTPEKGLENLKIVISTNGTFGRYKARDLLSLSDRSTASTTPAGIMCNCSDNETILFAIIGVLVMIIIVLITVIIWQQRKLRIIGNKSPYQAPEERDAGFYDNEIAMKHVHLTHLQPKNATQQQIPNELAYMPLQGISPTGEGSLSPVSPAPNVEYAPLDMRTRSWEVARNDVTVEKIIGKGAFGQVAKGTAKNLSFKSAVTSVAIKMVKANAPESDKRDLKSELELMKTLKPHPHVIKLLGCVTESEPLLVLIEYVPYGDLLGYLRKSRGLNDTYYKDPDIKPKTNLTSQQLMKFAWQIADGMTYLSLRKVVHRDLAARNILVGERETCKITDFGMARDVQQENIYERKTKGRLPVKWTAYESLLYGQYTTKSDVWSYGVILYEISTIGGSPYPRSEGRKIATLLAQGYRMPKPEHVDEDLYQIMMNCWKSEPEARPSFSDLTQQLKRMENQHKRLINMHIYDNALYANLEDLNA